MKEILLKLWSGCTWLFCCTVTIFFYLWTIKNTETPLLASYLYFPWLGEELKYTWLNSIWFFLFAVTHTKLAGKSRSLYLLTTGTTLLLLMSQWKTTEVILWDCGLGLLKDSIPFMGLILFQIISLLKLGWSNFWGFTETPKELKVTGLYHYVRHPMHLAILLVFSLAPTMSLDRLFLVLMILAYLLCYGIPEEEKRLIKLFGNEYEDYKTKVPVLIPHF